MKKPLVANVTLYRRTAKSQTHVINESPSHGDVYYEFEETWIRHYGDELCRHKRRVSQKATGRSFKFHDRITPELMKDDKTERTFSKQCLLLVVPTDFTYIRLTRI